MEQEAAREQGAERAERKPEAGSVELGAGSRNPRTHRYVRVGVLEE